MTEIITPATLCGEIAAISSKSAGHRVIIAAALCGEMVEIRINCISEDIEATCRCIEALGGKIELFSGGMRVFPVRPTDRPVLDCGESGSTARFMLPVTMALCGSATFTGRGRLPERPFSPLCSTMSANGTKFDRESLPIDARGSLRSGDYYISGDVSSQFLSGLLFALPLLGGGRIILTSPLKSAGYIDMTIKTLRDFGVCVGVERGENEYSVAAGEHYKAPREPVCIEGDWSNSAFWLVAGAVCGDISVSGLDMTSLQRDRRIVNVLREMGANISVSDKCIRARRSELHGIELSADDIPDIVPIIAVAAASASGVTRITNAERLKIKECNRLSAVTDVLGRLGADIRETSDGLIINGGKKLHGAEVDSHGDHRIAMLSAVAAQLCDSPVTITGSEAVAKSYPDFFRDYRTLIQ